MNVLNWYKISKVFSNILVVCTFRCYIIHIIREGQMSKCGGPVTNHFTQICGTKRDCMVQGKSTIPTIQFRLTTCNLCFSETIWWDRKVTRDAYKKSNSVENSFHRRGAFSTGGISKSSCDRLKEIEISSSPFNCQEEWDYSWCVET